MKNMYEIRGEVAVIFVNFKGNKLECLINKDDLSVAESFPNTWSGSRYKEGGTVYVTGTKRINGKTKSYKLHRLIAQPSEDQFVDHLNLNGLDNRRENLRVCSIEENNQNLGVRRNNRSGYRGVSYSKEKGKWRAYLTNDGKQINLGYFNSKHLANDAVVAARKVYMPFNNENELRN